MNCSICQTQNVLGAKFCKSCGSALPESSVVTDDKITVVTEGANETQILISLGVIVFLNLLTYLFYNKLQYGLENGWSSKEFALFGLFTNFLFMVGFILIPLALKNSKFKLIGIILAVLSQLLYVVQNISTLFSSNY
jgi:hypothetical protein